MRTSLLLFLLALQTAFGVDSTDWSLPKHIADNVLGSGFGSPTILSDPTAKLSHVMYCGAGKGLFYLRIDSEEKARAAKNIHSESQCYAISVARSRDGKGLFVAEGVVRGAVEDIFFLESADSGETWSVPVLVPRENQGDAMKRSAPSIVASKTGRLWIFYTIQTHASNRIMMVATRTPGSKVFANEAASSVNNISEADGAECLHLAWNDGAFTSLDAVKYAQSKNNGVTWSDPVKIAEKTRLGSLMADPVNFPRQIVAVHAVLSENHTMVVSEDNGATWKRSFTLLNSTAIPLSSQCRCGNRNFALAEDMANPTVFGAYDLKTGSYTVGPVAFRGMGDIDWPAVGCYLNADATVGVFEQTSLYITSLTLA